MTRHRFKRSAQEGDRQNQLAVTVRYMGADSGIESWASSPATRKSMQGNRSRDTKPEMAVRSAVHRRGIRFRVSARPQPELPRTADLVLRKTRIAVFVDGCYWHGCPEHHTQPATNSQYWADKVARNVERDSETTAYLQKTGWAVLRFWEHEGPEGRSRPGSGGRAVGAGQVDMTVEDPLSYTCGEFVASIPATRRSDDSQPLPSSRSHVDTD